MLDPSVASKPKNKRTMPKKDKHTGTRARIWIYNSAKDEVTFGVLVLQCDSEIHALYVMPGRI